jgi:hypothetical protein
MSRGVVNSGGCCEVRCGNASANGIRLKLDKTIRFDKFVEKSLSDIP